MNPEVEKLIRESTAILLNTNDERGFPHTKIINRPILRHSYNSMEFFLDRNSQTVQNISKNEKGNLCFFKSMTYESLLLKGLFTIEPLSSYDSISHYWKRYQIILEHSDPVIVCFELMTMKSCRNMRLINMDTSS